MPFCVAATFASIMCKVFIAGSAPVIAREGLSVYAETIHQRRAIHRNRLENKLIYQYQHVSAPMILDYLEMPI